MKKPPRFKIRRARLCRTGATLGIGCLILAGCRHTTQVESIGSSSFTYVEPPRPLSPSAAVQAETMLVARSDYRDAQAIEPLALPVYPPRALRARAGAASVGIHVTVDTQGRVTNIRPSIWIFSTPGPFADEFRQAVETAVQQWRFRPAEARHLEPFEENGYRGLRVAHTEPVEAEFDLAFRFAENGTVNAGEH